MGVEAWDVLGRGYEGLVLTKFDRRMYGLILNDGKTVSTISRTRAEYRQRPAATPALA